MADTTLTQATTLSCPHGGKVMSVPQNSQASAGALLLSETDTFSIAGCVFTLPGPTPSPCVSVEWKRVDQKVQVNRAATLSAASIGVCRAANGTPQGPLVIHNSAQPKLSTK